MSAKRGMCKYLIFATRIKPTKHIDMEEKAIEQLELTEKTVPKAVGYLINEVAEMRATVMNLAGDDLNTSFCRAHVLRRAGYVSRF